MSTYPHLPVPRRDRPAEDRYDWVAAHPFRLHVRRLMASENLDHRVVAGLAGVPDNVVRTLVHGRDGRLRPRIARRDARALLSLDAGRLQMARTTSVPATRTSRAVAALLAEGAATADVARALSVSRTRVDALRRGRVTQVTILLEQEALALARAHGIHLAERDADADAARAAARPVWRRDIPAA
ncbi:hypothetical protein GCM10027418_15330 [Mariniluteicoccus endophyticus]